MAKGTLTYIRQANPSKDMLPVGKITKDDMIYLHHFGTGSQELVMHTHKDAEDFAKANDCEHKGRKLNS
jgi:hypothetical protein